MSDEAASFDLVVTSCLRRAVRTSCLLLSAADQCWVPMLKDYRLNEQHSGALTGRNKKSLAEEHGTERVMRWRRGFDERPPAISLRAQLQRQICHDERYRRRPCSLSADAGEESLDVVVPRAETLRECCERVAAVWEDTVKPALVRGENVLVVSHGNTLRALISIIEGVSEEDSFQIDVPTACPIIYGVGEDGERVGPERGVWGSSGVVRYGRFCMDRLRVEQAQAMMREQVLRDIAVSTISSSSDAPSAIGTCEAWSDEGASTFRVSIGSSAESYTLRTLGRPDRQPHASVEEQSSKLPSSVVRIITPPMRNTKYEGLSGEAASSTALAARASLELSLLAATSGRDGAAGGGGGSSGAAVARCNLILVRHGYSEFNAANRFTGWADARLSDRGREEARLAGSLLREVGLRRIERVYCSLLERAVKTAWLLLDEMELQWVPLSYTWRLNERHYGGLTGRDKRECSREFGLERVQRWRRAVRARPPPMVPATEEAIERPIVDRRYAGVTVPEAESLEDCAERLRPFLRGELASAMRQAMAECAADAAGTSGRVEVPSFVISSSENALRALTRELEGISDEEIPLVDLPHAVPLMFQLDENLAPIPSELAQAPLKAGWFLADPARVHEAQRVIREELDCRLSDVPCADTGDECLVGAATPTPAWQCMEE